MLTALYALCTTVGPTADTRVNDLYVYSVFNGLLDRGLVPYRDFGLEYPPLALVPIHLPALAGGSYAFWLGVEMLLAALVVQACVGALGGRRAAWWFVMSPLLLGAQVRTHFDLVPVAMIMGALVLLVRARPVWALALLGVGGLTKLFPLLLGPVAVAWLLARGERRAAWRGTAACAAVLVLGSLPFLIAGGYTDQFRFHLQRPLQIEATAAVVVQIAGTPVITGTNLSPDRFKSNGVAGAGAGMAEAISTAGLVVALALAIAAAAGAGVPPGRTPDARRLLLAALAAVLAFVALGKVLSPQYMIWLAPFAALAAARRAWAIAAPLAAAIALTQAWFPVRYLELLRQDGTVVALVAARDALLLMALAATAAALARSPRPSVARRSG